MIRIYGPPVLTEQHDSKRKDLDTHSKKIEPTIYHIMDIVTSDNSCGSVYVGPVPSN